MAGEWIKVRVDLHEDPAVIGMAAQLGKTENEIVGALVWFWGWASRQSRSGNVPIVTPEWVDRNARVTHLSRAMQSVGWLEVVDDTDEGAADGAAEVVRGGGIRIPRFERHMSQSAKKRALSADRQQSWRARKTVTLPSRSRNAPSVTREEKRREEREREERRTHGGPGDETVGHSDQGGTGPPTLPPDCPALQFLVEDLSLPPARLPDARESILRLSYSSDDLDDWRECLAQAREILADETDPRRKSLPGDPASFLRSRMLKHRNPRGATISWWRPGKRRDSERDELIRALRGRAGDPATVDGQDWEITTIGLQGPGGIRPWGDLKTDDLRRMAQ